MRDILFRGKLIDNGEWVEGFYTVIQNPFTENGKPFRHLICNGTNIFNYDVIPEAVGQYTCLTDKNRIKIFEGDIVAMPAYGGGKHKAVVYFKGGKFAVDGSNYGFKDIAPKRMKVIGNIYDNKEILDVK